MLIHAYGINKYRMTGFFQLSFFEKYCLTKMLLTPIFHFFGLIRAWRRQILGKIRYLNFEL
jgi:hypothetical protein